MQTCNKFRREASAMYYQSNDFVLTLSLTEMAHAVAWIRSVVVRCGDRPFRGFHFQFGKHDWRELDHLWPIVQLYARTEVQLIGSKPSSVRWTCLEQHDIRTDYNPAHNVVEVVDEGISLGDRARKENWDEDCLNVEFGVWVGETQSHGDILKCLNEGKKKRKIAARRRAGGSW